MAVTEAAPATTAHEGILRRQSLRESAARTYARSLPIVPVRARGLTIEGADGRRYLDCLSGSGTLALGHNHPVVLEAIKKVIDSGAPLHVPDLATPVKDAFTTELFETLPRSFADQARVQFCGPAGTDAVEAALALVRTATGRSGILAFAGACHGMTAGALTVSGGAPDVQVTRLPYPQDYRCPFGIGGARGSELAGNWTANLLDDPRSGVVPPAGMILEPVQSEGGVIPGPDSWMRRMRKITGDRSIPLIADEVQTGVGRTGAFWAVEHSGIVPDVMVMSKAIGGSLPLAVIVYRSELDCGEPGTHAGTFRGNQLAMAAGAATLAHVRENRLAERAADLGARMIGRLRGLAADHPVIGDVRGRGLMIGLELVDPEAAEAAEAASTEAARTTAAADARGPGAGVPAPDGPSPADPVLAAAVQRACLARGLIVELGGRHASVVRLLPPLTLTDEQAEAVLDRLVDALSAAERAVHGRLDTCPRTEPPPPLPPGRARKHSVNPTPDPDAPETGDSAVPSSRTAGPLPANPFRADSLTVGPVSAGSLSAGPETVPRQMQAGRTPDGHLASGLFEDPIDASDSNTAAEAAAVENLLRCWVRETNLSAPTGPTLRIPLNASGIALLVPVLYWSATGWHRFGKPVLEGGSIGAPRADAVTIAALLGREAGQSDSTEMVGRVADSVQRTAAFITERRLSPEPSSEADPFLTAEQSLLLGHPLHPTPKSREGLSDAELRLYSPELHGSFALHWMAVDRSVLAQDSAWTEGGRTLPADQLTVRLAGALQHPDNTALLPLHPWQARDLAHRPAVASLLDAGLLHDLGPYGERWYPTSSVRTVHRPGVEAMLKLSLGVRITNSRRENLRKELHRGVEVHRVLRSGLGGALQAAHPGFDIVRDPAWLAVNTPDGEPLPGFDVVLRHNPFSTTDDAVCVAGLTAIRPRPGGCAMRSRLADIVTALAARTGRSTGAVATEWFLRYLDHVVRPVLWLDGTAGIALEAHQQNTIVILGPGGWPVGGRYRDNQGYYFRESHRSALEKRLPGIGAVSDTFVADDVTDERFAYYLAINNVFGLIGAFGAQRLADEQLLIAAFRQFLTRATALGSPLPAQLLDTPVLRTKANLLTRLHGLDELVGPVDTQSVYVRLTNPLHPTGA